MPRIFALIIIIVIAAVTVGSPLVAQTDTTFTYQGSLGDGGSPASGSYDLDFSLWDADTVGNQIGSAVQYTSLPVIEGLFTAELDFGALAFDNSNRWLEISVNGNVLTPRQPITRAPYSVQTRGLVVDEVGRVGIGTSTPVSDLNVAGQIALGEGLRDFRIREVTPADPWGGLIDFEGIGIGSTTGGNQQMVMFSDGFAGDPVFTVATSQDSGATWQPHLRLEQEGNLRLGADLSVAGDLIVYGAGNVQLNTSGDMTLARHLNLGGEFVVKNAAGNARVQSGTNLNDEGYVKVFGPNGSLNFQVAGWQSGNHGHVSLYNSSGNQRVSMWVTESDQGRIQCDTLRADNLPNIGDFRNMQYDETDGTIGWDTSSRRYKENIQTLTVDFQRVLDLQPQIYTRKNSKHPGRWEIGYIAEDLDELGLTRLVEYDREGRPDGVNYEKMVLYLTEVLKDQRDGQVMLVEKNGEIRELVAERDKEIAAQTMRLTKLERKNAILSDANAELQNRLDSLEQLVEQLVSTAKEQPK